MTAVLARSLSLIIAAELLFAIPAPAQNGKGPRIRLIA